MEERETWRRGVAAQAFYEDALRESLTNPDRFLKKVLKPEEMPWEESRQGRLKHIAHPRLPLRIKTVDAYIQEIPPGSRSGKHRHMAEEVLFILEGKGYDLHWDVEAEIGEVYVWKTDAEPTRWDWEAGDLVYIPPNTIHQHFNTDPSRPARFIAATDRISKLMGVTELEQLENAPEYRRRSEY